MLLQILLLLLTLAFALPVTSSTPTEAQYIAGARARASTPRLQPSSLSALPSALQSYLLTLHAAMRTATPTPGNAAATAQDCMAYSLAYERALQLLPSRAPNLDVWTALRLGPACGAPPPPSAAALGQPASPWPPAAPLAAQGPTFWVSPSGSDAAAGSEAAPFATVARGVGATRAARSSGPATLVLRAGLHVLGGTVQLDSRDSGLTIAAAPGEAAWVSGGAPVGPLAWQPVNVSAVTGSNVWAAHLPSPPAYMTGLNTVAADGSPDKRLYRAVFPNFNPEMHATGACGGGPRAAALPECAALAAGSPFLQHFGARLGGSKDATASALAAAGGPQGVADPAVLAWLKPANFSRPKVFFKDLLALGLKNDSLMPNYNRYSTGRGGACGLWTDAWPESSSYGWDYHCGNVTDGGWEEVDELMQTIGQLNLPVGLMYSSAALPNMAAWQLNTDPSQRTNGAALVNVWMTQNWFNNFFYVTGARALNASAGVLDMVGEDGHLPSGGWQGGRHWQTRCSFQGCGPGGDLLGGAWSVSNVAAELDAFDEYFFDPATNLLTVFYNASSTAAGAAFAPPPANLVLMAPQLEIFFNLSAGASDITLHGLGFRDQRTSVMDPWVVPSGGDWGLRPAGAVQLQDTQRCTVSSALFQRTDGNAVYLGGWNRNASVLDSEFVWLGMNAVASLGLTEQDDATGGEQPYGTLLSGLVARELALVEKQSSAYFVGRTPLSRVENCIFYNGPRAMINFNDHLGGGNNITTSLLFNTCRESSDHGNLNSWNRMPFLTSIASGGGEASYTPALTETTGMFVIANYGAAQGYDNDDGSSEEHIRNNFFYQADGLKMDYGGHDSIFENNVVIVRPFDSQNCQNMWGFVPGHQHRLYNNTCAVWQVGVAGKPQDADMVLTQNDCGACGTDRSATPVLQGNRYYTTHGNASVNCGGEFGTTIADMQAKFPTFEVGSSWHGLPDADTVIQWGRDVLRMA